MWRAQLQFMFHVDEPRSDCCCDSTVMPMSLHWFNLGCIHQKILFSISLQWTWNTTHSYFSFSRTCISQLQFQTDHILAAAKCLILENEKNECTVFHVHCDEIENKIFWGIYPKLNQCTGVGITVLSQQQSDLGSSIWNMNCKMHLDFDSLLVELQSHLAITFISTWIGLAWLKVSLFEPSTWQLTNSAKI